MEEGHRASEQLFTEFFDNATSILWIKDLEGRFLKVNGPTACAIGRPVEEIIGRTVADLVSPAEAEIYSRNDQEAIRTGRSLNFTETMQLPDGLHSYRVAKFPLRDSQGEIYGIGAICTDITAQKRTELALWESDASFRGFFEHLTVGAAQLGRQGRFIRVNGRFCEMTGYSREELLAGMSPLDLDHPEEREADRERIKNILAGKSCDIEKRYVRKDGSVIWVRVNVSAIVDADGRFVCSIAVIDDITERRQAEDSLRADEARQAFIVKLADAVRTILDPAELQRSASTLLGEHLGAACVHYAEYHEEAGFVLVPPDYVRCGRKSLAGRYSFADFGEPPDPLRYGEPLVVPDTEKSPLLSARVRETCRACEVRAFIAAPLMREGRLVWTLTAGSDTPRDWSDWEVKLVQEVGDRTWMAIERARAEAASHRSEERLRLALKSASMGTWDWDFSAERGWVTSETQRMFGLPDGSPEPLVEDYVQLVQHGYAESFAKILAKARHGEGVYDFEYRIRRANDGEERWIHSIGKVVENSEGRKHFLGVCRDITERKVSAEALQRSEEWLRLAQQVARIGIFDFSPSDRVATWTPEMEALYGLKPGEFGKTHASWEDLLHPEDRARAVALNARTLRTGEPIEGEWRVIWPDGSIHWLFGRFQGIKDSSGRVVRLTGVNFDITARKEAEATLAAREQELKRVLDTAATGLARITRNFHYIFANPLYAELVGAPLEEILRGRIGDVVGPKALEAIQPYIDRVLDGERVDFEMEVPFARGNRHLHVVGTPDEDSEGQIVGWFVSLTDISERKALEREVLRISEDERRRIATDLHDGICQELIAVGFAAKGLERQLEKEGHSLAAKIKVITEGVSQAAAHTRLVAHGLNPIISGDDGLMHALRDLAADTSKASPVRCQFECDAPVSIPDPLVSNQLYLIAREAIENSAKHSGAKRIRVELAEVNQEICLAVWDDGCGLPIDVIHRSGFGLRGMKYRAGLIGGQLTVRSREEGGTMVSCRVPKNG